MLDIAPEIQYAFHKKLPVLSLESTILTHGMPYPENITTAMQVQHIARNQVRFWYNIKEEGNKKEGEINIERYSLQLIRVSLETEE